MKDDRDDLRTALERRIGLLDDEERQLRARLKETRRRLEEVRLRRARAASMYRDEFGDDPPGSQQLRERDGRFAGVSWPVAIRAVLRESDRPLHRDEIWSVLEEGDFETESDDPRRTLVAVVARLPDVERIGPATYELKEEG